MIIYDPEEYKETTSNGTKHSARARWHDKVKMVLFYYKTHRVQKGEALFE